MPINHADVENFHVKLNRRALGELLMEVGLRNWFRRRSDLSIEQSNKWCNKTSHNRSRYKARLVIDQGWSPET